MDKCSLKTLVNIVQLFEDLGLKNIAEKVGKFANNSYVINLANQNKTCRLTQAQTDSLYRMVK